MTLRVLGRIRLSKDANEAGTSVERQRESIEQWASMHGHEVVGWAVDSGVSGSVSPFDTPELGPWLTPARLPEWDILVAYRLDRLARSTINMNKLFAWALDHKKTVASATEGIDLSGSIGRLIAHVIAFLAEGELEAIRERNTGSQKKVRELGRWHGGRPPYGYRAEKKDDGWYLAPDPEERRVIREVIMPRVLAHESVSSIARHLNEVGIPTRTKSKWTHRTLLGIMRGNSILGQHNHNGKLVRDSEGLPQLRAEPLLTMAEYDRVQKALSARSIRYSPKTANLLQGVLFCYLCQRPMYKQTMLGTPYVYYRCSSRGHGCNARGVRAEDAFDVVENRLLAEIGDTERTERVYVAGSDHTEELAAVREAIDTTRREKDLGLYDGDDEGYFGRLERLTARRRELEALPSTQAGFQEVGLGETYGQAWKRMDPEERRSMLLSHQIRVSVAAGVGKQFFTHLSLP